MNPEAIRKTAVCRYDAKEILFVVESPLLEICSGIADTEREARELFEDGLQAMYIKYLEGKVVGQYAKRGRPAKNRVNLSCQVKPDTAERVRQLAASVGTSQGEILDYLLACWSAQQQAPATAKTVRRGTAARTAHAKRIGTSRTKSR